MTKKALSQAAEKALGNLKTWLAQHPGIVIAYSGGMDSGFLALAARKYLKEKVKAFFAITELMPSDEVKFALEAAGVHDIPVERFEFKVLGLQVFKENPKDRCYHCKHAIFSRFIDALPKGWILCDGSNIDDRSDYRPGKKALAELKVASPLDEAGFNKALIREVLQAWGKGAFDRPAQACLATRVETGKPVTLEVLRQIEAGEMILKKAGFAGARFRHHGEIARIEVMGDLSPEILNRLHPALPELKTLGYKHVTLDLEGYKRGSMS